MGQYAIKMPDIGEGIAEVELVKWRVQPGDTVAEDQILADVMTDKATVEIPSPVAGTVLELGGQPGKLMAVGAELIRLEVEGTGNLAAKTMQATVATSPSAAAPTSTAVAAPPVARAPTQTFVQPPPAVAPTSARAPGDKPMASPSIRHRARELGIDLQLVQGHGPSGRITHDDLDHYHAASSQPPEPVAPAIATAGSYVQRHGEQAIPLIGLRRKIAEKMQEAKRHIPHFSYVEEIDVTELEALRQQLNDRYSATRGKLTLLPLLARAVVLALRDFPQINARFDDSAGVVTRYAPVHLGIATQTDAGLLVPVLHHAEAMDPWACAREITRLAEAGRSGKARRDELSGSTITISSLGPLGGIVSTPVINYPEVAIVGVNRIVERPVFRGGAVVARQLMNLSSSFDHRVIDGMDAAQFIQAVRALLETPAFLLVE